MQNGLNGKHQSTSTQRSPIKAYKWPRGDIRDGNVPPPGKEWEINRKTGGKNMLALMINMLEHGAWRFTLETAAGIRGMDLTIKRSKLHFLCVTEIIMKFAFGENNRMTLAEGGGCSKADVNKIRKKRKLITRPLHTPSNSNSTEQVWKVWAEICEWSHTRSCKSTLVKRLSDWS